METLSSFAKENFELITLIVGLIGVSLGIWSVCYEYKKKKKDRSAKGDKSSTTSDNNQ